MTISISTHTPVPLEPSENFASRIFGFAQNRVFCWERRCINRSCIGAIFGIAIGISSSIGVAYGYSFQAGLFIGFGISYLSLLDYLFNEEGREQADLQNQINRLADQLHRLQGESTEQRAILPQ